MQWLIDIVKQWTVDQGYLDSAFVDRGDPAVADYTPGFWVKDGAWHTLYLDGIVDAGAKAILMAISIYSTVTPVDILLRKFGNANEFNISKVTCSKDGTTVNADIIIPCSPALGIQYKILMAIDFTCSMTVKGWFL